MGTLKIETLGTSFSIQASEEDEYLKKLLNYYTKLTDHIEKSDSLSTPLQVSILAGIMLCDELYKEKSKKAYLSSQENENPSETDEELNNIINNAIEKIDKALM